MFMPTTASGSCNDHRTPNTSFSAGSNEIRYQQPKQYFKRLLEDVDEKADSSGESGSLEHHQQKCEAIEKKIKKHRYAFKTRSHVDILDDGYRWRKYGQKSVKNNKFPRSYYRCTHQACGVKKQVQRLSMDEAIVITTYEGVHSHPIQKNTENFEHILTQMQIYNNTSAPSL